MPARIGESAARARRVSLSPFSLASHLEVTNPERSRPVALHSDRALRERRRVVYASVVLDAYLLNY